MADAEFPSYFSDGIDPVIRSSPDELFFFAMEARPGPNAEEYGEAVGAFVNCWVDTDNQERVSMGKLVTIERKNLDPNRCYGVIVSQSVALTLLHYNYDFQFDGYMAVRTKDIAYCSSSKSDDYGERLMRREGLWENIPQWVKRLSIGGWPDLIAGLVGKVMIIEDEVREGFHTGPVLTIVGALPIDPIRPIIGLEVFKHFRISECGNAQLAQALWRGTIQGSEKCDRRHPEIDVLRMQNIDNDYIGRHHAQKRDH